MKAAMVSQALRAEKDPPFEEVLVHTGQHYDDALSGIFFRELDLPAPRHRLEVGSAPPAKQVGAILDRLDPVLEEERPEAVLVYGDTNSTLAAALAAAARDIPVVHVEAGERIFRRHLVPEETNRVVADQVASLCLTVTERARSYLLREGMHPDRVRFVGDPMLDLFLTRSSETATRRPPGAPPSRSYHLATLHRAENTVDADAALPILGALDAASKPVLLPIHPRLRHRLGSWGWRPSGSLRLLEPQGYLSFLDLLLNAHRVVTDSGGVAREAFFARRPCVVPMPNSWWSDLVEAGWAAESGGDSPRLRALVETFEPPATEPPAVFGEGDAARRIVREVAAFVRGDRGGCWHPHGDPATFPRAEPRGGTFTLKGYAALVARLRALGYRFVTFREAARLAGSQERFVFMRHDVDVSLEHAAQMAEFERELGVVATYFFLVRTEFYNVFSRRGSELVHRILAAGHRIGLHFDERDYPEAATEEDLSAACRREVRLLEDWLDRPVDLLSFHRPSPRVLAGDAALSAPWPHTYLPLLQSAIRYHSDSRGRWARGDPSQSDDAREGRPMHILVHPVWWTQRPLSPYDTLLEFLDGRKERLAAELAAHCRPFRVGRWATEGPA